MAVQTEPPVDKLLSAGEVARTLSVSKATVRRLSDAGALPVVRLTPQAHRRYRARDVAALIARGLNEEGTP